MAYLEEIFLCLTASVLGIAIGGGVGAAVAFGIRRLSSSFQSFKRNWILLPWVGIVTAMLVSARFLSSYLVIYFGIGIGVALARICFYVAVASVPAIAFLFLEHWHSSSSTARVGSVVRALIMTSFLVGSWSLADWGLASEYNESRRMAQPLWSYAVGLGCVVIFVDLLLAVGHGLYMRTRPS